MTTHSIFSELDEILLSYAEYQIKKVELLNSKMQEMFKKW